jgi:CheY-like chemotaxis protein
MANLLIIDDDPTIRQIVGPYFKIKGYAVTTANNGVEGVEAFKTAFFDMVITDLMMPRMNGFEVIDHIKGSEKGAETPIILLTADKDDPELQKQQRAHFQDDTLAKPFDVPALERMVISLLNF